MKHWRHIIYKKLNYYMLALPTFINHVWADYFISFITMQYYTSELEKQIDSLGKFIEITQFCALILLSQQTEVFKSDFSQ